MSRFPTAGSQNSTYLTCWWISETEPQQKLYIFTLYFQSSHHFCATRHWNNALWPQQLICFQQRGGPGSGRHLLTLSRSASGAVHLIGNLPPTWLESIGLAKPKSDTYKDNDPVQAFFIFIPSCGLAREQHDNHHQWRQPGPPTFAVPSSCMSTFLAARSLWTRNFASR